MAMGFKDILSADRAIFMNPEEFGEVHNVGGRSMTILIDDNEMIEREKRQTGAEAYRQGVLCESRAVRETSSGWPPASS